MQSNLQGNSANCFIELDHDQLGGEGKTTYLLSASFRIYKNNSYITLPNTLTSPSPPDPPSPPAGTTLTALTRYLNV